MSGWNDSPDYTPPPPPKWFWALAIGVLALIALGGAAFADPCEAELPTKAGTVFSGTVKYVVDGDGICVGAGNDPHAWIEVRLADFDAPELHTSEGRIAKNVMERIALGQPATCVVIPGRSGRTTSWDRVHASCEINGASLAALMRDAGVAEGGR